MCGVIAFHLLCYLSVNYINDRRPATHFFVLATALDSHIPYLGWTWPFYYIGVPYMSIWAFWVMRRLPEGLFRSSLRAYLGMIIAGAATQLIIPARSPWPEVPAPFQGFMHTHISYDPYVCLPSMHVALSVLPACLSLHALPSRCVRVLSLSLAALICVSTLTMKEHYLVDTVSGLALGLATYLFSRRS